MATQRWSRDAVVREILSLKQETLDLTHNAIAREHSRLVSAAVRYFGSWGAAVAAAGVDYAAIRRNSQMARARKITKWSRERIDSEIKQLIDSRECLGAATVRANHPALFSEAVSLRYYGSWRAALTSVGVDYDSILDLSRSSAKPVGDARGTRSLARKLRALGPGVKPLNDVEAQAKYPRLHERAVRCFGSWEAALVAAFGL